MTSATHRHRSRRKHGHEHISFWKDAAGISPICFALACTVLVSGLLLGGIAGWFGDTLVQLLALPLIVLSCMEWSRNRLAATDWAALALIAGVILLGCIQLVPLPRSVWAAMPARGDLQASLHVAGTSTFWSTISLNPLATERALQWTLPALAMMLAVRWMSDRQRRVLLLTLFSCTLFVLIMSVAHNVAPASDVLSTANEAIAKANLALNSAMNPAPLQVDAPQSTFAFFSNRNHLATLLAMALPLVAGMGLLAWYGRTDGKVGTWVPWTTTMALVLLGLLIGLIQTHSRAALALGPLALSGSLLLLRRTGLNRKVKWAIAVCALATIVIAIQMAGSATVSRFDGNVSTDTRWKIHATTIEASRHFGPLGSGLGTFVQAYQQVTPVEGELPSYINHAHGDYHELWLETGVPGTLLVICFLGWFAWSSLRAWRGSSRRVSGTLLSRAASLSILMVLLHSYVDYPLRRTAVLIVFGMACALLAPAEVAVEQREARKTRRKSVTLPSQSAIITDRQAQASTQDAKFD
jgi:hypothetical protein